MKRQQTFMFEGVTFRLSAIVAVGDVDCLDGMCHGFTVMLDGGHEVRILGFSDQEKTLARRTEFCDLWVFNIQAHE